jgi:hypothetical protein
MAEWAVASSHESHLAMNFLELHQCERSFEEAFGEVLKTPAGRRLGELAEGPHRHQRAAEWQAGLIAAREARRKAHLRSSIPEGGHHERGEGRYSGLARLEA